MAVGDQRFGIIVKARTGQARRELARLRGDSEAAFGGAQKSVAGLTTALGAAGVALGAVSAGITALALKTSASLETAFSEVATISSFTADETERLRGEVRALAVEVGGDEVQAVKALYQIISAGATDASDASALLRQSVYLAKAGVADLDVTAKSLSSTVNSFGIEIGEASARLADMIFTTVQLGQTTIPELASSLGRVAKVADTAGVSVEELLGFIAALTKAGLSTDEAITAIRQVLFALVKPGSEAAAAFEKLGIEIGSATLKEKGFAGVFAEINKQVRGNLDVLAELIPNIRGIVAAAVAADRDGLQLLIDSTDQVRDNVGAVNRGVNEFADDLETRFRSASARARGALSDLGRELTPFATEILDEVAEELEIVIGLFGDFIKLLFANGAKIVETLQKIGAALLLVGGALAGQAVASGIIALGKALEFLVLNVLTAPGGVAAGLASLANPITALGVAVGAATVLIGKQVIELKRAAKEAERIADLVEDSEERIQSLGKADLSRLELVVGILKDFQEQLRGAGEAGPGLPGAVTDELLAARPATKGMTEELENLLDIQEQWRREDLPEGLRRELWADAQAAAKRFSSEMDKARETSEGFRAETKSALSEYAPAFTEGAIRSAEDLNNLIEMMETRIAEVRAATSEAAATPTVADPTEEVDPTIEAMNRLGGVVDLVRRGVAGLQTETATALDAMRQKADGAFGPGGALSPENIAELGDAFDQLDIEELVDQLFGFGELEQLVGGNISALEDMLGVLQEVKEQAGDLLTDEQIAAFELIIETVAEAVEEAAAEMAEALRLLKGELEGSTSEADRLRDSFIASAAAFARAMGHAAASGRNILEAFRDWVISQVINALAMEFALLLTKIPGIMGSPVANLLLGGAFRSSAPRPISQTVEVDPQAPGLQVNVELGAESMVEVVTSNFRARRSLFRDGVRPEQLLFDQR